MHVDAFFEYIMDRRHPYWTDIPLQTTPVIETGRDGVPAEDDMALRALLPHIKPQRGRKKPDDKEAAKSPSQRPSPSQEEYPATTQPDGSEPWTAHPDGRGSVFMFPPAPDPMRLSASMAQTPGPSWSSNDIAQTPLTAYPHPHSALTPVTRNAFWADPSEPKSAITPGKPRSTSRRHGAKVVSSAWRIGGASATGKTRGRPPINKDGRPNGPFSAFPGMSTMPTWRLPRPGSNENATDDAGTPGGNVPTPISPPIMLPALSTNQTPTIPEEPAPQSAATEPSPTTDSSAPRPAKRSRLSLQVPARQGGEVRLATPPLSQPQTAPPVVMVNGHMQEEPATDARGSMNGGGIGGFFNEHQQAGTSDPSLGGPTAGGGGHAPTGVVLDPEDRTNVAEIEAIFMHELLAGAWVDVNGNPAPKCTVDEAWAFSQTVVENLLKSATTKETFLINLSSLAGGHTLMTTGGLRVTRLEEHPDRSRYRSEWELKYGGIRGTYQMEETVLHSKWKVPGTAQPPSVSEPSRRHEKNSRSPTVAAEDQNGDVDVVGSAAYWKAKYVATASMLMQRDEALLRLRRRVMESVSEIM